MEHPERTARPLSRRRQGRLPRGRFPERPGRKRTAAVAIRTRGKTKNCRAGVLPTVEVGEVEVQVEVAAVHRYRGV